MLYTPEKSLKRMAVDHYQSYLQLNGDNQTLNETIAGFKIKYKELNTKGGSKFDLHFASDRYARFVSLCQVGFQKFFQFQNSKITWKKQFQQVSN